VATGALSGLVLLLLALAGYVGSEPRLAFPRTTGNVVDMGIVILSGALELTTVIWAIATPLNRRLAVGAVLVFYLLIVRYVGTHPYGVGL
jgi:hypothetical protein